MKKITQTRALLLAAHGSLKNGQSSDAVYQHAHRIREKGIFHEVRAIFWKEEPYFHQAADIVGSDLIYVVPFFMSHGYFTRQILPRELGSPAGLSDRLIVTQPVGTHPDMLQLLLSQIQKAIPDDPQKKFAIALIGHGTPKDKQSSASIYRLARQVREKYPFNEIDCFFLDEKPLIEEIPEKFEEQDIHLFPIFIGEGLHTQIDIPERMQLDHEQPVYGPHLIQDSGLTLNYHPPLGVLPEATAIILQRLMESDGAFVSQWGADPNETQTYLRPAAQFFLDRLHGNISKKLLWGELVISGTGRNAFEIRHADTESAAAASLRKYDVKDTWKIAKLNSHGEYRALKCRPDLQSGWIVRQVSASELIQTVDHFYPATIDNWYRIQNGQLTLTQFHQLANRQSGVYRKIREITQDELQILVERCCQEKACLKSNLWFKPERDKTTGADGLLCSEPCAVLMEEARKMARQKHSKKFYEEQV